MKQELSARKRFGLLISHLASDYARKRCLGVERAAEEAGVDLVTFPGSLMQDVPGHRRKASSLSHSIIFEYAARFHLDALLLCAEGIADCRGGRELETFLGRFSGTPILLMEARLPGYRSLVADNPAGIRAALEHLILVHHCRRICYLSGPEESYDAQERRQAYLDVMQSHGLPVGPDMMASGGFSLRCEEAVSGLLASNPGLEAICCADDRMAACACRELTRRGLIPGRDIAVTGFGDAELAKSLDPPLTTYQVNSYQMGYQAVYEALHLLRGEPQQADRVGGELIVRSSCGCDYRTGWGGFLDRFLPLSPVNLEAAAEQVLNRSLRYPAADPRAVRAYLPLLRLLSLLTEAACSGTGALPDEEVLQAGIRKLLNLCASELCTENLQYALDVFLEKLSAQVSDPERQNLLLSLRIRLRQSLFDCILREKLTADRTELEQVYLATDLMQSVLSHSSRSPEALREICYRLRELGIQNAYLYTCPEAIPVRKSGKWHCAERMRLAAYLKRGTVVVPEKGIPMENRELLQRLSAVQDRRCTMLALCLITEEEQHGFLLCESDLSRSFIPYVAGMQIGAALKFFSLLEQRTRMEAELQAALDTISRKNEMLQLLSTKDDLTRSFNRRGFLEQMQLHILRNLGKPSALCLLDLDNLKSINDLFGHREGDYALSRFARLIQNTAEPEDVFGRYGGDEFILLIPQAGEARMAALPDQLRKAFDSFNRNSRKPYYIEASLGVLRFVCSREISMENLLGDVDKLLYRDKKRKRRSAVKEAGATG